MTDYCVFILTYKRPDNVKTYKTLRKQGYTGKIFLIVGDDDPEIDAYKKKYGDEVIVFKKESVECDLMDNFRKTNTVLYARNESFDIAKRTGYKYFLQLDDDYIDFQFRYPSRNKLKGHAIKNLDTTFGFMFDFLKKTKAVSSVAMSQGGDYIGGIGNSGPNKRKLMNTFFCCTDRRFDFVGRMNDDVNTYVSLGNKGVVFLTVPKIMVLQAETQKQKGGLTEMYLDSGTYVKSFYSVMVCPSAVKISTIGFGKAKRIHHKIDWNNAVPKIIEVLK